MSDAETHTRTMRGSSTDTNSTQPTLAARAETSSEDTDSTAEEREADVEAGLCPECESKVKRDSERGEVVCTSCGLVVEEDEIDHGPEWRAFDSKERDEKSRVGSPTTKMMHDEGLSTNIGWENKDGYGNSLSANQRQKMQRLRKWNERFRTRDAKERNLKQALGEIDRMASALGLPDDVRETAGVIYRRCLDEDLLPGRSIEGVATACLYTGARQHGLPRSIEEVESVSRVDEAEFTRTYRYIVRELNLPMEPPEPKDYIPRFVSELDGLDEPDKMERVSRNLLNKAKDAGLYSGKSPTALAAAAIYSAGLLTKEQPTQTEVGSVADVSEVTVRNRYQELFDNVDVTDAVSV